LQIFGRDMHQFVDRMKFITITVALKLGGFAGPAGPANSVLSGGRACESAPED